MQIKNRPQSAKEPPSVHPTVLCSVAKRSVQSALGWPRLFNSRVQSHPVFNATIIGAKLLICFHRSEFFRTFRTFQFSESHWCHTDSKVFVMPAFHLTSLRTKLLIPPFRCELSTAFFTVLLLKLLFCHIILNLPSLPPFDTYWRKPRQQRPYVARFKPLHAVNYLHCTTYPCYNASALHAVTSIVRRCALLAIGIDHGTYTTSTLCPLFQDILL